MTPFTPWTAMASLSEGLLIGLTAVLLLLLNGRVAGVSGITAGLLTGPGRNWRLLFLVGLMLGAGGFVWLGGPTSAPRQGFSVPVLVLAGLLVGYGTHWAGGCTSGHGVCGLARLSLRSLVAVAYFLSTGIVTAVLVRHLA